MSNSPLDKLDAALADVTLIPVAHVVDPPSPNLVKTPGDSKLNISLKSAYAAFSNPPRLRRVKTLSDLTQVQEDADPRRSEGKGRRRKTTKAKEKVGPGLRFTTSVEGCKLTIAKHKSVSSSATVAENTSTVITATPERVHRLTPECVPNTGINSMNSNPATLEREERLSPVSDTPLQFHTATGPERPQHTASTIRPARHSAHVRPTISPLTGSSPPPVWRSSKIPVRVKPHRSLRQPHATVHRPSYGLGPARTDSEEDQDIYTPLHNPGDIFNVHAQDTDGYTSSLGKTDEEDTASSSKVNFDKIDFFDETEGKGPDIHARLAKIVDTNWHANKDLDAMKVVYKKYLTPGNCVYDPPAINEVMKKLLSQYQKKSDFKFFCVQRSLAKAMTVTLEIFQESQQEKPDLDLMCQKVADQAAMLGEVSQELSTKRRTYIKGELREEYKALCDNTESKEWLFGDDLPQVIANLGLSHKIAKPPPYKQFKPVAVLSLILLHDTLQTRLLF